jgi:hypothetical protein
MHPSILAKRKAQALERIGWTAEALAKHLELDPVLIEGLQPKGIKDPAAAEMMRLEGLSDLLTAVAIQTGAVKESAPEPGDEETVSTETPEAEPTMGDLPAPVLEDDDFEEKPKRKPAKRSKKQ